MNYAKTNVVTLRIYDTEVSQRLILYSLAIENAGFEIQDHECLETFIITEMVKEYICEIGDNISCTPTFSDMYSIYIDPDSHKQFYAIDLYFLHEDDALMFMLKYSQI